MCERSPQDAYNLQGRHRKQGQATDHRTGLFSTEWLYTPEPGRIHAEDSDRWELLSQTSREVRAEFDEGKLFLWNAPFNELSCKHARTWAEFDHGRVVE